MFLHSLMSVLSTYVQVCFFMWRNFVQEQLFSVANILRLSLRTPLAPPCISTTGACYTPVQRSALHTRLVSFHLSCSPAEDTRHPDVELLYQSLLYSATELDKGPSSTGFLLKRLLYSSFICCHLCLCPLLAPPQVVFAPPLPFFLSFCSATRCLSYTVLNKSLLLPCFPPSLPPQSYSLSLPLFSPPSSSSSLLRTTTNANPSFSCLAPPCSAPTWLATTSPRRKRQ